MRVTRVSRAHLVIGTAATALLAGGVINAIPAAAVPESNLCPVAQMEKVWAGGEQDPWTFDHCGDLAARYDHLFYPGEMLTRDLADSFLEQVVIVQMRLRDLNYRPMVIDGRYGPQTAEAVTRYQRNHRLVVDGKVGEQTWRKLFGLGRA